jgi:hypothetical protein
MKLQCVIFPALFAVAAGAGAAQAPGPCSLLSRVEVEQAIGAAIADGTVRVNTPAVASCSFDYSGGGSVAISIRHMSSRYWSDEQIDRMRRGVGLGSYRETAGLGRRSFLLDLNTAGAVLCVFQDSYYLRISVLRVGDPSRRHAILEKLAQTALNRISPLAASNRAVSPR